MSALSTPDLSPTLSPNTRARRLSARRGSVAAVDPWGAYNDVNMNPSRSLSSRLTIVRVPQTDVEESQRRHRRHGSNASINSTSSGKGEGGPGGRLSFAFSSFSGGQGGGPGGRPASPSSPRMRPSSPSNSRFPSSLPSQSKLSPEQIVDIARSSVNPRSPLHSPNGPLAGASSPIPAPVSFTPLPDSIYLPFIERPAEVAALIQSQPNARLFALLQQTFPPDARALMGSGYEASKASPEPKEWTYADLEYWLTRVDRDVADDEQWIRKARRCIMHHSELIWERVKGALGVPPELDVEDEGLELPQEGSEVTLSTANIDANVFEPDSPVVSTQPVPDVEVSGEDITIEPVFANQTPPLSASKDPLSSSLGDLREEDENENEDEEKDEQDEQEVHGLRIMNSPSAPTYVTEHIFAMSPMSSGLDSPVVQPKFAAPGSDDKDTPYDVLRERGPGHPLFPSNFAQLSLSPTLQPSKRAQSMSYPPRPAYLSPHAIRGGMHRAPSIDAGAGRAANMARPEWARNWDPSKHEYAVTTGSTGSFE
ncbi:hypothetical protein L226DRAFT_505744 [Lentinus tigrinus ALCF2SS1-7]|uniref:Uncharacterized protein n=1 Tax=Lentinus tigrinus ALCF2SS1-6 TaxID=1328759 RepID=A0A5C2SM13_9APHY|nr:hypothetical protein L227DRAFT_520156 [Lentinus tigrinus ALCF2SS1-6]RPD76396.1 hypothetical protein L226DRAFT_505744 [Lentinus tigrinus ALCF2SS1-7]